MVKYLAFVKENALFAQPLFKKIYDREYFLVDEPLKPYTATCSFSESFSTFATMHNLSSSMDLLKYKRALISLELHPFSGRMPTYLLLRLVPVAEDETFEHALAVHNARSWDAVLLGASQVEPVSPSVSAAANADASRVIGVDDAALSATPGST